MSLRGRAKSWAADAVRHQLDRRDRVLSRPRFHEENSIDLRALLAAPIQREKGRFVVLQIGANDGVTRDPIRAAVIERGWDLYAVEPLPEPFARLQQNYADHERVRCINRAVGFSDGTADLFYLEENGAREPDGARYDQYASFSREVIEHHWRAIPDVKNLVRRRQVPVQTLRTLCEENSIPDVDMLQIDTEGFDFELIKMAFDAGMRPTIIAFEWVNLSRADMWECRTRLIEQGYRWLMDKGDVIAVVGDELDRQMRLTS